MFDINLNKPGRPLRLAGLNGSAEAVAVADLAKTKRVIVFTRDPSTATRMTEQICSLMDPDLVCHLVGWEILPYDATSPSKPIATARIAALSKLLKSKVRVFITSATDALLPCMPPALLNSQVLQLAVGDDIDTSKLSKELVASGCVSVDRVRAAGEFAVYGGQIDLYPGGVNEPIRLVCDLDRIAQIRTFDPATQLSTGSIERINLLPSREYPLDDSSIVSFRACWREHFHADVRDDVYQQISQGEEAEGAEFFMPLFYSQRHSIFDYLKNDDVAWIHQDLRDSIERFSTLTTERYEQAKLARVAALAPHEVFLNEEDFFKCLKQHEVVELCSLDTPKARDMKAHKLPAVGVNRDSSQPYANLEKWLKDRKGRTVFVYNGAARRKIVDQALAATGVKATFTDKLLDDEKGVFVIESSLSGGFDSGKFALVSEAELHDYVVAPQSSRKVSTSVYSDFTELSENDLVVHQDHGIAIFQGLSPRVVDGYEQEFIKLEFADQVIIYVAVVDCHLISRQRSVDPDETVKLDTIGGKRWKKTREKAEKAAHDTAAYLLEVYAKRLAVNKRQPCEIDEQAYAEFCSSFPYSETADQIRCAAEIAADQCLAMPMDRLVCGDVGFGKTEIAMRAIWIAWSNGYQVAVIAPTTLLADQLYRCVNDRFAGLNAKIYALSSLRDNKEKKATLAELAKGGSSIVVGTHSLLSANVSMPNLRLVVIDEEHRFGVRQKDRLRELRSDVDVLALSATPIPRTLSMSLQGLRDISLLATPPPDRQAIRTFISADGDSLVREALDRELARGGQVFYVHHRTQTIRLAAQRISDLSPGAKIAIAHGSMPHQQLEAEMRRFYRGEVDVLVSTTIIESGLDVANANTMIVPRADMFGLAQLHQLRGRVGRSARQGYAYLLVPSLEYQGRTKVDARLATLSESAELGGGHYIAARDLEIRGAGELLGDAQSGVVNDIGIEAFRQMLDSASRALGTSTQAAVCEVDVGSRARLPTEYCKSSVERMRVYRELARIEDIENLELMREKLGDRFGPLPEPVRLLLNCHRLRLHAATLGVKKVQTITSGIKLVFVTNPPCTSALIALLSSRKDCSVGPDNSLRLACESEVAIQLQKAYELCDQLHKLSSIANEIQKDTQSQMQLD